MTKSFISAVLLVLSALPALASGMSGAAQEKETLYWRNIPLKLSLSVGQERLIMLPMEANVHIHPSIAGQLSVNIMGNNLFLRAVAPFAPGRIKIKSRDPKHPYLLIMDVSAVENGPEHPVEILIPSMLREAQGQAESSVKSRDQEHPYAALSRYVFQRMYLPERLWEPFVGVYPTNVFSGYLPLYQGGEMSVRVLGSFRKGEYFATAVEVTNKLNRDVEIDVRKFRGEYKARAGHVYTLEPSGSPRSKTAFVLITDKPFNEAVGSSIIGLGAGQ